MKKILLLNLLLAMLLGATNAWAADDDLYCCGQKQTSLYNWKYTPTNNINGAIQMGSISYDAASKTVTFDGAYATVTGDNRIFYNKNVPGLKIVFKGYCRLRSDKCVFRLDKDTEMKGSTDRVEFMALGDNAECIYCPNETSLTISDFAKLRMTSKYWRAINTNGTHVKVQNSNLSAEGADCAIQNNKGSDKVGHLELVECRMRDVWSIVFGSVGELYYKDSFDYVGFAVHTSKAKSVMIIRSEDCLGVCLKGIELTKGWCECTDPTNPSYDIEDYYTYDESTNTLTLKKDLPAEPMSDELYDRWVVAPELYSRYYKDFTTGIIARRKAITIDGGGHFVYGRLGMLCRSDVTLRNIIIGGNEDYGIEIYISNSANNVTLTLKDNVIIGGVENAICGRFGDGDVVFNPSPGTTVQLFPCDKNFKVKSTFDDKPIRVNSTTLQDCYVSEPAGGGVGTSGIEVNGNTVFSKVVVTGTTKYDLWIGDTQVTSLNASDILGDGGHFRYNPSTNVLRVTNATYENTSDSDAGRGIINKINNLTVTFVGDNTFTTYKNAVRSTKSITLTGIGSFTATSTGTYSPIYFEDDEEEDITCTIDGLDIDLTGNYALRGYKGYATVNVTGSSTRLALHSADGKSAIFALKALNLDSGLYISEPIGGYYDSNLHGITVNGTSLYYGDVVISNVQNRKLGFSINGTEMTTLNMNNVPEVVSGSTHIEEATPGKPTLVLNNATLDWNDANDALYLKSGTELTIRVLGDCVINAADHAGLNLSGNTTITGGGTLRINSKWAAISNWEDTRFTLQNNTTLIAHSSDGYGYCDEGYDYDQQKSWFIIQDGGLFAAFGKYGPISFSSDRAINFDSYTELRYPVGGQLGNNYVYDVDGNEVTNDWVVIGPDNQTTQDLITASPLLTSPKEEGQGYNLAGQKVGNGYRGIVIKDGKKMLIK